MRNHTLVLWPTNLSTAKNGFLYGWRRPLICVAGIIPLDGEENAQNVLRSTLSHTDWINVRELLSADPIILGHFSGASASTGKGLPPLASSLSSAFHLPSQDWQLVLYKRHKPQSMRFYSFDFSELDILPSQATVFDLHAGKMPHHTLATMLMLTPEYPPSARVGHVFDGEVLCQVNLAQFLDTIAARELAKTSSSSESRPGTPNLHEPAKPSDSSTQIRQMPAWNAFRRAISAVYKLSRMFSTTAEQFDVRYEQSVFVFGEVPYVYRDKARTVHSISKYIKFHNCVWLVLNDVIIGAAFGSFLHENQDFFARCLCHGLRTYLIDGIKHALLWLNNWPAGLKLNTELSQFYSHSLIGVVSVWGWLLDLAAPYFPVLFWVLGAGGCCGMTMIVSLASDMLSLLTVHLYVCYYISTTVFSHQLSLAGSLWNLFRGKRYNVLRNRIDTWDYDLDQLLLGTILFTLLAFLYPTVLTYYALFATTRLAVIIIHALFDTITTLLNHFPLFALLLRVKDPLRLPGGVCIQQHSKSGLLILTSLPATLSSIFRHYAHLAVQLTSHYHPVRMLGYLASGQLLVPIPRASIRFSMIPASDGAKRNTDFKSVHGPSI